MTTLFPEWEARRAEYKRYPTRLRVMWRMYGRANEGTKCETCAHCLRADYHNKTYYKCDLYRLSRSEATYWRLSWPACGKHEGKVVVSTEDNHAVS